MPFDANRILDNFFSVPVVQCQYQMSGVGPKQKLLPVGTMSTLRGDRDFAIRSNVDKIQYRTSLLLIRAGKDA